MNVNEFAEQVVFGTTLEDKLLVPGKLTHSRATATLPSVENLTRPGRSRALMMQPETSGAIKPPAESTLENESARGQLLHFLANHELLATELMALVLLKFPNAPRAFRQGVLVTLQEEQEHTRMYIQRMKECGVEFGSYPLSGQFWRVVEPMKSPMDFVSRLSLTFEQANLDYSLHFASVFKKIGDDPTSNLLQKIYEDEISHVQHGLQWFRQWKDPDQSDWDAYQESLEFPMSPQRGRGPGIAFNREGRKRAGLSEDFIDAIEVFRQSRGKATTVRWFDPAAEAELAGETSNGSVRNTMLLQQLGSDLERIMVAVSKPDDIILVRNTPSRDHRKHLIDAGFKLPEFVPMEDRNKLSQRKLHDCSPWAWTPTSFELIKPFGSSIRHQPEFWNDSRANLFRKSWAMEQLDKWLAETESLPDQFVGREIVGIAVSSIEETKEALRVIASRGFSTAIFKKDLSASGRGQRRFDCRLPLDNKDESWLAAMLSPMVDNQCDGSLVAGPFAIVEPELNRVIDLSFLWHLPKHGQSPRYLGCTRPLVSEGRRYAGTLIGANTFADCDSRLKQFLLSDRGVRLQKVAQWLEPRVVKELQARQFEGYFGIDAFVVQRADGEFEIKPLAELNPRMTMGHIALSLRKRLAPGVLGAFRIFTQSQWNEIKGRFRKLPLEKLTKETTGSHDALLVSGAVELSEPDANSKLVPVLLVGKKAIALTKIFEQEI